ncbi:hypothetical protein G9A89_018242 [Geosiphon pyriformis]|nr:hypothetical protein G9A89_018242 [Geosiphon pyriformis]
MAYAPIAKLDNFISKENDTQIWLNNIEKAIVANEWNDDKALQVIPYFLKDTANLYPAIGNNMATQKDKASETTNHVSLAANNYSTKECETTFLVKKEYGYLHDEDKIWQIVNVKVEGTLSSKILKIKNNPSEPTDIVLVLNPDTFINLENSPEEFHKHYQNLAPTREKQKQCLEEINTQLCDHCLIPCDFQFCDDCNLIYNPLPRMIYMIPEKKKPINSCTSELESSSNPDSNFDNNNNENNSSNSIQNGYNNDNNSNSNSNSDSNYEQYIALSDLTKKQELKWFSDNDEGIMPECVHNIDAEFDLRYPGKDAIKLEPHLRTCINLKIALEILATTIVQLAFRSSLAKKGEIIDAGYVENIIAMLQNDSEKAYVIEPNERIAQAIFLSLVKIAQLISVENRKELGITARGIQRFGSTGRIDVPVNMVKEEIIGQGKIISTG